MACIDIILDYLRAGEAKVLRGLFLTNVHVLGVKVSARSISRLRVKYDINFSKCSSVTVLEVSQGLYP